MKKLTPMKKLTINEIIFIAIIGSAMGIMWWAYTFINDILAPILKLAAIDSLLSGVWLMGGTFFGYIIRKPGSAFLGEIMAAIVQGFISRWGISSLIYGLTQGIPVELCFLLFGYRKWNYWSMSIAGIMAACCSYATTVLWYGYFHMNLTFHLMQLGSGIISGIIFPGILAKIIADKLFKAQVLNQFNIAKDAYAK
jgi:energy-coupling factor transport system permease protein